MTSSPQLEGLELLASQADMCEEQGYVPFMMDGFVSLVGNASSRKPVRALRDTVLRVFSRRNITVVWWEFYWFKCLSTGVWDGLCECAFARNWDWVLPRYRPRCCWSATVSSRSRCHFILGNDLAGGKVFASPEVTNVPLPCATPDELVQKYPEVFPSCAVTRAMSQTERYKL